MYGEVKFFENSKKKKIGGGGGGSCWGGRVRLRGVGVMVDVNKELKFL